MRDRDGREEFFSSPADALFCRRLLEIVRLHGIMFERLLSGQQSVDVLAELLRDVGETYLDFSRQLNRKGDLRRR